MQGTALQTKNWHKIKLGEIAQDVRESYSPTKKEEKPYIGLEHIEKQTLQLSDIGKSNETQSAKKIFKAGDVLFGTLRPYFRKVVKPDFDGVCSTDIAVIRPTQKGDADFLKYFIANQDFIDYASNISGGTRMPRANWKSLKETAWPLPELNEQRKIGEVLSAYDDLIENNTKRIRILEEIAQAIYLEWFVFSIDKDKLPKGWKILQVKKLVRRVSLGKLYDNKSALEEGRVPILDQGKSGIIGYHNEAPGVEASIDNPIIVFANHTCYQRLILFPFSAIQNVLPFCPSEENHRDIFWLHYATKDLIEFNDYKGHWPEFMQKEVLVPPVEFTEKFGNEIKPFVILSYRLELENQNLRQARDLLLPKLVTGEIEI